MIMKALLVYRNNNDRTIWVELPTREEELTEAINDICKNGETLYIKSLITDLDVKFTIDKDIFYINSVVKDLVNSELQKN